MQVHVKRDANTPLDIALSMFASANVNDVLERFSHRITSVEVHLSGTHLQIGGGSFKRCLMEARLVGSKPLFAGDDEDTIEMAVRGATDKLLQLLTNQFGRLGDKA